MALKPLTRFYLSCFLSSWGDRLWFFALSIYFVTINQNTLLITAINGFACNVALILFGSTIGNLVDTYQRINVIRISLFIQNLTVSITCGIVVLILSTKKFAGVEWSENILYAVQAIMIALNMVSNMASMTTKIAIERDWVIVIADYSFEDLQQQQKLKNKEAANDDELETAAADKKTSGGKKQKPELDRNTHLSSINSNVRRLDLQTSVLAPLIAGLIMSFINFSPKYNGVILSAIIFGAWNLISYFLELSLLNGVYSSIPQLQKEIKQTTKLSKKLNHIKNLYKGWYVYMKQGIIVLPSIALAVLYLTVLSFDSVTIGYARSQHIGETLVSIFQAVGNVTGIIGTFVFQAMRNRCRVPLRIIGLIGSTYQLFFLIGCFISIWLPGSPFEVADREYKTASDFSNCTTTVTNATDSTDTVTNVEKTSNKFFTSPCQNYTSIMVLLTTMALSRFGLWMIDLAINQSIQETVSEKERGVVGGVQTSFNRIFELIKYATVIVLPGFNQYGYLVIMSFVAVSCAFCLYMIYVCYTAIAGDGRRREKSGVDDNQQDPNESISLKRDGQGDDDQEQQDDQDGRTTNQKHDNDKERRAYIYK